MNMNERLKLKSQLKELIALIEKARGLCNEMPENYKPADAAFIALKDVSEIAEDALFELERNE
jgi:hypothetical protein